MWLFEVKPGRRSGRGRYWRPNAAGYTDDIARAGLYDDDDGYVKCYNKDDANFVLVEAEPRIHAAYIEGKKREIALLEMWLAVATQPIPVVPL